MIVYRIAQDEFIRDLSGYGAYLFGGRWSLKGYHALYTASFRSLAYLEYIVHQFGKPNWPAHLKIATIVFDSASLVDLKPHELPPDWHQLTYTYECQKVAPLHFDPEIIGIAVPSVIVKDERNIILNPLCDGYDQKVKILHVEDLEIDQRFRL